MGDTLEQGVDEIDRSVECENDEEGPMIGVEMRFIID